jgi:hypothetical protein
MSGALMDYQSVWLVDWFSFFVYPLSGGFRR